MRNPDIAQLWRIALDNVEHPGEQACTHIHYNGIGLAGYVRHYAFLGTRYVLSFHHGRKCMREHLEKGYNSGGCVFQVYGQGDESAYCLFCVLRTLCRDTWHVPDALFDVKVLRFEPASQFCIDTIVERLGDKVCHHYRSRLDYTRDKGRERACMSCASSQIQTV